MVPVTDIYLIAMGNYYNGKNALSSIPNIISYADVQGHPGVYLTTADSIIIIGLEVYIGAEISTRPADHWRTAMTCWYRGKPVPKEP